MSKKGVVAVFFLSLFTAILGMYAFHTTKALQALEIQFLDVLKGRLRDLSISYMNGYAIGKGRTPVTKVFFVPVGNFNTPMDRIEVFAGTDFYMVHKRLKQLKINHDISDDVGVVGLFYGGRPISVIWLKHFSGTPYDISVIVHEVTHAVIYYFKGGRQDYFGMGELTCSFVGSLVCDILTKLEEK